MTEKESYTVTPDAWMELFALFKPLIENLSAWSQKHDLPMPMVTGAVVGVAEVIDVLGNSCDCFVCDAMVDAMADEVVDRMLEPMAAVRH